MAYKVWSIMQSRIILYMTIEFESQPGSWLVAICERSENRGSGGGSCQTGQKSGKWVAASMVWQGNVPGGKTVTVGIDSP